MLSDDGTGGGEMVFHAQVVGKIIQIYHFIRDLEVVMNVVKLLFLVTKHVNVINI